MPRWWILGVLLALGCREKVFYLPEGETGIRWPQAGRTAAGRGFADWEVEPPLQLLWQQKIDATPVGGAVFAGGLVLQLTTVSSLYAFDRHRGQLLGRRGSDEEACAPLALADEVLVYAKLGKKPGLRALDRQTRKVRWTYPGVVCAPPVVCGDTLLVAREDGILAALRCGSGEDLWQREITGRLRTAPSAGGGAVYVGNVDGRFVALDLESGEERWQQTLETGVRTRAAVGEDRIFVGTAAGVVQALEAASGELVWQTSLGALLTPGMALSPQALVVGAVDHHVYGLDPASGEKQWSFATEGVVRGTPAATPWTVYCGSSDGYIYALESESGRLQWKYRLDGPALTPVVLGRNAVCIVSESRTIYVFGRW